jgi:hypothetical protein
VGDVLHRPDRQAGGGQRSGGPAAGDELGPALVQAVGKGDQAVFVGDGEQYVHSVGSWGFRGSWVSA